MPRFRVLVRAPQLGLVVNGVRAGHGAYLTRFVSAADRDAAAAAALQLAREAFGARGEAVSGSAAMALEVDEVVRLPWWRRTPAAQPGIVFYPLPPDTSGHGAA